METKLWNIYWKIGNFDLKWQKYGTLPKQSKVLYNYDYRTQIYYGKKYGILDKVMVLRRQLWYYRKMYCTIPKTMKLYFVMEKVWYYAKNIVTTLSSLILFWSGSVSGKSTSYPFQRAEIGNKESKEINITLYKKYF